jgi:hypothetical protein
LVVPVASLRRANDSPAAAAIAEGDQVQTRPQRADRITDSATLLNYAQDRQPPYNLDAERAILGAVFLDREAVGLAIEKLMPEEFYRKEHRLIFAAMCGLYEQDQAIDPITVSEALEQQGQLPTSFSTPGSCIRRRCYAN